MAYACGWGGIITLVGTPPNIIGSGALTAAGLPGFSFFEFAWIGIPLSVAGILYMLLIGKYLLPKAELDADQEIEQELKLLPMIRKAGYFRRYLVGLRNRNGFEFEIYQLGNDCYYRRFGMRTYWLLNRKTGLFLYRLGNYLPVRGYDACVHCNG